MEYYSNGRKYIDDEPVDGITVIGVDNPIEIAIQENAPSPFVYGVKKICTCIFTDQFGNQTCTIYDVINGTYLYDQPFKGYEWLTEPVVSSETAPAVEAFISIDDLKALTPRVVQ